MSRRFQARRASRISSNRSCNSCSSHPRSVQSTVGNTNTAASRATQGASPARATQGTNSATAASRASSSAGAGQTSSAAPNSSAGGDQVKLSTKQEENAGAAQASNGNAFGGFLSNLAGNLGLDDITKKLQPLQLNDKDKALLSKTQDIHKKLAGSDGVWDASDKARNLQQLKGDLNRIVDQKIGEEFQRKTQGRTRIGTRFKQAIGRMHMKNHYGEYKSQGMGQANSQARAGLDDGQKQLGIADKTAARKPSGPETLQPLTVAEMETFGQGMRRLQQLGKEQGKPNARFTNGLPNQFFTDVLNGKLIPSGVDLTPQ